MVSLFGVTASTLILLLITALIAGAIDAAIGGGGLIQLPMLMIVAPWMSNAQALGTNKLSSLCGTISAAVTMQRKVPAARAAFRYIPFAFLGSAAGALCASALSKDLFRPIIIVAMLAVGLFITVKPAFGTSDSKLHLERGRKALLLVAMAVAGIGFYDGIFGPGTGMFLIIAFTSLLGSNFLESTAMTKTINSATNLGAIVVFALHGDLLWLLGLTMGAANLIGGNLGARFIIAKGSGVIRVLLLVLVVVMATKLAYDQWWG